MYHIPVLLTESLEALRVFKDKLYFDGTLGGGGHSSAILKSGGRLIATDRDIDAIEFCRKRFVEEGYDASRYTLINDNFKNAASVFDLYGIDKIDGALLDLGVSSHQIDSDERGFSYKNDTPLDMRMDKQQSFSAVDIVNEYTEEDLSRIIFVYGEERYARRIAENIVKARQKLRITTTGRLAEIIKKSIPWQCDRGHPAKRSFQAIRIEVNGELEGLKDAALSIFSRLNKGGRLCIISFHSLEDRIIKNTFRDLSTGCMCDKSLPICVCGHEAEGSLIGKGIRAADEETIVNQRSKSATLRVIEKL